MFTPRQQALVVFYAVLLVIEMVLCGKMFAHCSCPCAHSRKPARGVLKWFGVVQVAIGISGLLVLALSLAFYALDAQNPLELRVCSWVSASAAAVYGIHAMFVYMFLFLRQRLRPFLTVSLYEKAIFGCTAMAPILSILVLFTSTVEIGEKSECVPRNPVSIVVTMLALDTTLSLNYLWLFIQPLRKHLDNAGVSKNKAEELSRLIYRNAVACMVTILATFAALTYMTVCEVYNLSSALYYTYPGCAVSIVLLSLVIVLLTNHKGEATSKSTSVSQATNLHVSQPTHSSRDTLEATEPAAAVKAIPPVVIHFSQPSN